jgi:hypothetical protein
MAMVDAGCSGLSLPRDVQSQSPLWVSSGGAQGQHVTYGYTSTQLTSDASASPRS